MALPNGKLMRYPILSVTGTDPYSTMSQKIITEELNNRYVKSEVYTKSEVDTLIKNHVVQTTGTSTINYMSQKAVTDELNKRYTKTESDKIISNYYKKDEVTKLVADKQNIMLGLGHTDLNMDLPGYNGLYYGNLKYIKGTIPEIPTYLNDKGDEVMRNVAVEVFETDKYEEVEIGLGTSVTIYQRLTTNPLTGNPYSSDMFVRMFSYALSSKTIFYDTGWGYLRSRWQD